MKIQCLSKAVFSALKITLMYKIFFSFYVTHSYYLMHYCAFILLQLPNDMENLIYFQHTKGIGRHPLKDNNLPHIFA